MSQESPTSSELEELEGALNSEVKTVNIRLREGEYQFRLAKAIASFELELSFPDVKDLVRMLFGEKKTEDVRFVSKIQTILKKMEKSGIVRILPKEMPWELQRYVLSSFRFQDVERNTVVFAAKPEIDKTKELIRSHANQSGASLHAPANINLRVSFLILMVAVSLTVAVWTLAQSAIDPIIFASAFCTAAVCSTILGALLARKK